MPPEPVRARERGGGRPGRSVATRALGTELRADRDQCRKIRHGIHVVQLRHADEAVRVEIVAEQQCVFRRGRGEEPRAAVMEEIALVDGLYTERAALVPERREDRLELPVLLRAQSGRPERALAAGAVGDLVPETCRHRSKNRPAASIVRSISSSPCASDTNIASY